MYGHTFYARYDDHINNVRYPCVIPYYALKQHKAFEDGELEPFFLPDSDENARTRLTIDEMIDYVNKKIGVAIEKDEDLVEIYTIVTEFEKRLRNYLEIKEVKEYYDKLSVFISMIKRPISTLERRNPELYKKTIGAGVSKTIAIFKQAVEEPK